MPRSAISRPYAAIESIEPRLLMAAFTVTSVDDSGPGTLRQAILDANTAAGADEVRFNIPGEAGATRTVQPVSPLPLITDRVVLNGRSQPGSGPTDYPIHLDGALAGANANGLKLTTSDSHITGFRIGGFGGHGIMFEGGGNHQVYGNIIGADVVGNVTRPGNGGAGVYALDSAFNQIGGDVTEFHRLNVIAGNGQFGVQLVGTQTRHNHVQMNFIGATIEGTALGNQLGGIQISQAEGNTVGIGFGSSLGTVISGNNGPGVVISGEGADSNLVLAANIGFNYISDLSSPSSSASVIANAGPGVRIEGGAADNQVLVNKIGGNAGGGVVIVDEDSSGNIISGNLIGIDYSQTVPVGNGPAGAGVVLRAPRNQVGGNPADFASPHNVIAFNAGGGVIIQGNATPGSTPPAGNIIRGNSIFSNGGLGIDLRNDGVTPNDPLDPDRGPNNLQNFPVLTSAGRATFTQPFPAPLGLGTRVRGTLNSTPNTTFRLQFYSGPADASGSAEGKTYLGTFDVTTDAAGNASFDQVLQHTAQPYERGPAPAGEVVTATATAPDGSTSEFSNAALVPGVVDRHLFYNGSSYDGGNSAATPEDDNAIAPDMGEVLPLGFAGLNGVSRYYKGINGVMIDLAGRPAGAVLTAADFDVKVLAAGVARPEYTESWPAGPAPSQVVVRPGAGTGGTDRVTLIFADGAIKNTWVRIEVKPNERTGLTAPDVFFYGSLSGETSGSGQRNSETINALDLTAMKRAITVVGSRPVAITETYDHNRDGRVNALDLAVIKRNLNATIPFFTPRLPEPPFPSPAAGARLEAPASDLLR